MKSRTGVERIESESELSAGEYLGAAQSGADEATSLEELSLAYAKLLSEQNTGTDGSSANAHVQSPERTTEASVEAQDSLDDADMSDQPIEPRAVIEAMLFVGHPDNKPLTAEFIAGTMRGMEPSDVAKAIAELNILYQDRGLAFEIVAIDGGYRLQVSSTLESFRNRVNAKVRETQLQQSAIDCLSLVAYQPGTTREEIERLWGRPAGSVLSLLVRRELLRVDRRSEGRAVHVHYYPTERFLNLVGIASLDDLPTVDGEG